MCWISGHYHGAAKQLRTAFGLCHDSSPLRNREPFATPTCICGAQSGGRTRSVPWTTAFEAAASANFAIWACDKSINPSAPPRHPVLMVFVGCPLDWIARIRRRAIVWIAWATVVAASFTRIVYVFGIHAYLRFHKNCWISVSYTNGFGSYCWLVKMSWLSKPRYRFIAAQTAALLETPARL